MIKTTDREAAVLSGLLNNDFGDGEDGAWIWSDCINAKGVSDKSLGGIVASLVKKGLAETSGNSGRDACVRLTDAGTALANRLADLGFIAAPAAAPAPVETANFILRIFTFDLMLDALFPVRADSAAAAIKMGRQAVKDAGISRIATLHFRATKA